MIYRVKITHRHIAGYSVEVFNKAFGTYDAAMDELRRYIRPNYDARMNLRIDIRTEED